MTGGPSPKKRAAIARRIATEVLRRVATDDAWASRSLDAEIRRAGADRRDAALATEIVYGALRVMPELDAQLARFLKRSNKLDPWLRASMRAGAYQLMHLSRVPPHAAVSDAVTLVREQRGSRLSGVANAVLRKVAKERPEHPSPPDRVVLPDWLDAQLRASLGDERHAAFVRPRRMPPPLGLRAHGDPDEIRDAILAARPGAEVELSEIVPGALLVRGAGDPRELPGFDDGAFALQEVGSQRVTDIAAPIDGERLADLCAGRGTKSLAFAARGAEVVAVDLYEEKLARMADEAARLGIVPAPERHAIDLRIGLGDLEEASFDRVVLDAPCTGLGTLHRRPELALRLTAEDPARLAELQGQLLRTARRLVRPGGELVYAVCSPMPEEGLAQVEALEASDPSLERAAFEAVGPWSGEDLDAYQVARWRVA